MRASVASGKGSGRVTRATREGGPVSSLNISSIGVIPAMVSFGKEPIECETAPRSRPST